MRKFYCPSEKERFLLFYWKDAITTDEFPVLSAVKRYDHLFSIDFCVYDRELVNLAVVESKLKNVTIKPD